MKKNIAKYEYTYRGYHVRMLHMVTPCRSKFEQVVYLSYLIYVP